MIIIKRFILMIQFLTAIPLPIQLKVENKDFGRGLVFAPWVGVILGGLLAGLCFLLQKLFPLQIVVVFIAVAYGILTGGLHLDGLADTFDGLFSHRSKERILEIMRDSRIGTNGVLAIVGVILLNLVILYSIGSEYIMKVLVLLPVAGRMGSLVGAGVSRYARTGEGLGKSFIEDCGIKEIIIGLVLCIPVFLWVEGVRGLILLAFPVITAFIWVKLLSRKIGGATGDILGAVCELNQTTFLVITYILLHIKVFSTTF